MQLAGILLAAGRGRRFDPSGASNKLLAPLPDGTPVVLASARSLLSILPRVIAVVAPSDGGVGEALRLLGCTVSVCPGADAGMGHSLAHALCQAQDADGWLIALGDMPHVQPSTLAALCAALEGGADIALPVCRGRRGNPVAFAAVHRAALLALAGEEGARAIVRAHSATEVQVGDCGIFQDIDTRADL